MNIQIYGKNKCFDTKKAERFFKERRIKFHSIDIIRYGLSRGEFDNIKKVVGIENLIDNQSKDYERLHIKYQSDKSEVETRLFENHGLYKTPIVRNGKKATVGFCPDIWKSWFEGDGSA